MQVAELTDDNWPSFLEKIRGRELDHYWFTVDWTTCRSDTRIWTAEEEGELRGALLLYKGKICHLRGDHAAASDLVEHLGIGVTEAVVPRDCADIIEKRFNVVRSEDILLMSLRKGNEKLVSVRELERLTPSDAPGVHALLREADPITWGELTQDGLSNWIASGVWYGIRDNGKLIAGAGSWFVGDVKLVNIVAVDKHHRGKGMARTVLSRLLIDIFRYSEMALIHVRADNEPALRAYRSVGYLPELEYRRIILRR